MATYPIVKLLSGTSIPCFWYIHEWVDQNSIQWIKRYISDNSIIKYNIKLLFPCVSAYENYKTNFTLTQKVSILSYAYNLNSIENNRISPISFTSDKFVISIVGTIDPRKNQQSFIDNVFYRICDNFPNTLLLLVGKVHKKLNIRTNYTDSIVMTGDVNNALPYTNKANIHVSYSVNEVLPLNILEAMYCKKPVVTSNAGGISEVIENNKNGFIFNINDSDSCYTLIANLITNKELREDIGTQAHNTFLEKFNEDIIFPKFIKVMQDEYPQL